jgi:hypothetical protein
MWLSPIQIDRSGANLAGWQLTNAGSIWGKVTAIVTEDSLIESILGKLAKS